MEYKRLDFRDQYARAREGDRHTRCGQASAEAGAG
jgi:hypothetical protein